MCYKNAYRDTRLVLLNNMCWIWYQKCQIYWVTRAIQWKTLTLAKIAFPRIIIINTLHRIDTAAKDFSSININSLHIWTFALDKILNLNWLLKHFTRNQNYVNVKLSLIHRRTRINYSLNKQVEWQKERKRKGKEKERTKIETNFQECQFDDTLDVRHLSLLRIVCIKWKKIAKTMLLCIYEKQWERETHKKLENPFEQRCVVFAIYSRQSHTRAYISRHILFRNAYKLSNTYIYQIILLRLQLTHVTSHVFCDRSPFFDLFLRLCFLFVWFNWLERVPSKCVYFKEKERATRIHSADAIKSKQKKMGAVGMRKLQIKWRIYFITNVICIKCMEVVYCNSFRFASIQWKSK